MKLAKEGTVYDSVEKVNRDVSALSGEYNKETFYVLAGARVSIGDGGSLTVTDATVYTENMNVTDVQSQDTNPGNGSGGGNAVDITSTFDGEIYKSSEEDTKGDVFATGIFKHYSDAKISQVFSEATVYNVGSVLYATDGKIEGLGTDVSGKVKVVEGENGGIDFVAAIGTVTYTDALGKKYELDRAGNKEHVFTENDISYNKDTQHIAYYNGQTIVVDNGKLMNINRGVSFIGTCTTADGSWNNAGNDVIITLDDGTQCYIDPSDIRYLAQVTDANGNGTGIYVGYKSGDKKSQNKAGNDDILVKGENGDVFAVNRNNLVSDDITIKSPYINGGADITITAKDLASSPSKDTRSVTLEDGSVIYVKKDALDITDEHYTMTSADGSTATLNIHYRTDSYYDYYDGVEYTYEMEEITYTVDDVEYKYNGSATDFWGGTETEFKLKATDGTDRYINLEFTGNDINAETVLVGGRSWFFNMEKDRVTTSVVDYHSSADGSGSMSEYRNYIGEYDLTDVRENGTFNLERITKSTSGSTHSATSVTRTWDKLGRTTSIDNMKYEWTGSYKDNSGRPKNITIAPGTSYRETYAYSSKDDMKGVITSRVDYYGSMSNITYDKNRVKSFSLNGKETLTEITTQYRNGNPVSVNKEVLSAYSSSDRKYLESLGMNDTEIDRIIGSGTARVSYQYVEDVQYLQSVSNVKRESYAGIINKIDVSEEDGRKRPTDITYGAPAKVEFIVDFKQNTSKTTLSDDSDAPTTQYKNITTTTTNQDIVSIYNYGQDDAFAVESELLSPETRSTLYDDQNRVVYETQKGGVYQVRALTGLSSDKVLSDTSYELSNGVSVDLSEFVGTGIEKGDVLSLGKKDSVKSYTYYDNGDVETNSYTYSYNYLDQSALYDGAENGTVEITLEYSRGQVLMETTTESFTYALNEGTKEAGTVDDYNSRTVNYETDLEHTYSYSLSASLGGYGFAEGGDIDSMMETLELLGDSALMEKASSLSADQLSALMTSDSYTFYGINVDFKSGQVTVDENMATTTEYDALGRVTNKKVSGLYKDTKNGSHEVYSLANADFLQSTDVSSLNLSFNASGVFSSKSVLDKAGNNLASQSGNIISLVEKDRKASTNNILGTRNDSASYVERIDSNFKYDALGRVVASENTTVNLEGIQSQGIDVVNYTRTGANGVTIADTYSFNVEGGQVGYYVGKVFEAFETVGTDEDTVYVLSLQDKAGHNFTPASTGGYGYNGIGYSGVMNFNPAVVEQFNKTADARDAERLTRYQTRNEIWTGVVTAVYVAASVALAIVTFGSSALIQLTLTSAITAVMALATIPAVYNSMKKGMEAATVGDTKTAVMEFAFVALDFAVVAGTLLKGASAFAKGIDALSEVDKAAKLGELSKLSKFAYNVGSGLNGMSAAIAGSKFGKVLKFLNPMTLNSQRIGMFTGGNSNIVRFLEGSLTSNAWVHFAGKAVNLASSIALNSVIYGIHFGPSFIKHEGLISKGLRAMGLDDIADNEIFQAVLTIATFSPIFNKEYARQAEAGGKTAGNFKDQVFRKYSGGEWWKNLKEMYGASFENFKANILQLDSANLTSFKGVVKELLSNGLPNYLSSAVYQSAGMIADITKFNFIVSNVLLGGIKTVVYNTTGVEIGGFIFDKVAIYSSGGDFLGKSLTSSAQMMTNKNMWGFSFITPVVTTIAIPLIQSIPGIGEMVRSFNFASSATSNRYLSTFIEENVKEEVMGKLLWSWVPNAQLREILQECFDDTPDANFSMLNYNNETYQQIGVGTAQNIANMNQAQRAQEIARVQNTINRRANELDNGTRRTDLTSSDIIANRGNYRVLMTSTDSSTIRSVIAVEMATSFQANMNSAQKNQLIRVVASESSAKDRSSYLDEMRTSDRSVGLMATYLQDASSIVLANKGTSDSIGEKTEPVRSTQLTDYIRGVSQVYQQQIEQGLPVNEQLTRNFNSAFKNLEGSYETINAAGTALRLGVDYDSVKPYIKGIQNTDTVDFNADTFNYNLQEVFQALDAHESSAEILDFVSRIKTNDVVNSVIQHSNIKDVDLSRYTVKQAKDVLNSENVTVEQLYFASQILNAHYNTEYNSTILQKLDSLVPSMMVNERKIASNIVTNIQSVQSIDMSSYKNIKNIFGESKGRIGIDNVVTQYDKARTAGTNSQVSEAIGQIFSEVGSGNMEVKFTDKGFSINGKEFKNEDLKAMGLDFFARSGKDKFSEDNLRDILEVVKVQYNTRTGLGENAKDVMNDILSNLVGLSTFANYFTSFGEGKTLTYDDYLIGQKIALYQIYTQIESGSSQEDVVRYINKLQTGGGKTVITAITTAMLLARAKKAGDNKFVTVLTNTNTNAKELQQEIQKVLGIDGIVPSFSNDNKASDITDDVSLVITDYSAYNGAIASDWSKIFESAIGQQLIDLLASKGIEVTRAESGKLELKNPKDSAKVLAIMRNDTASKDYKALELNSSQQSEAQRISTFILGMEGLSVPLARLGDVMCDEVDYFATTPQQALAQAQGMYISERTLNMYQKRLENIKNNRVKASALQKYIEKLQSDFTDLGQGAVQRDISAMINGTRSIEDIISGYKKNLTSQIFTEYFTAMNGTLVENSGGKPVFNAATFEVKIDGKPVTVSLQQIYQWQNANNTSQTIGDISERTNTLENARNDNTSEKEKGKIGEMISRSSDKIVDVMKQTSEQLDRNPQEIKGKKETSPYTPEQIEDMIIQIATQMFNKYGSQTGFTAQQVFEHINNAISAYGLAERGDFKIINSLGQDYDGTRDVADGTICVIYGSQDSPDMTMPAGQMQALEAMNGLAISKPSKDSYVSNSVTALNLFSNIIGVTGTVSDAARNKVFEGMMGFKVEGDAPNLYTYSTIVQNANDRARYIYEMTEKFRSGGQAVFNLILTADSAQSYETYRTILERGFGRTTEGISDQQLADIISVMQECSFDTDIRSLVSTINGGWEKLLNSAGIIDITKAEDAEYLEMAREYDVLDKKASLSESEVTRKKALEENKKLQDKLTEGRSILADRIIETKIERLIKKGLTRKEARFAATVKYVGSSATKVGEDGKSEVDLLKAETKAGLYDYIMSDATLIGRGWDAGKMVEAQGVINTRQKKSGKVIANNFLLDSTMMTQSQLVQGAGRIDPYGKNRFSSDAYEKHVIELHSVENLRNNETLSKIVGSDGAWTIDIINAHTQEIQMANEERAIEGAGINTKNTETTSTENSGETTTISSEQKVEIEQIFTELKNGTIKDGNIEVNNESVRAVRTAALEYKAGNKESAKAVEIDYFLTDAQLAKIVDMSDTELATYLKYNLAAKKVAEVLNRNMREAVEREISSVGEENIDQARADYDTLFKMVKGEIKGRAAIMPMLEYLKDNLDAKDYDNFVRVLNGEKVEKEGKVIEERDVISGLINGMTKKYGLNTAVPYSVFALAGFRDGQKEAFRDILQATVENGGEVENKSAGYAQELQTAGGKSIIGLFSVLLLSANPSIEGRENKFITWLTNENSNAEDLYNHIKFVFGDTLGNVELITNTEDKEGLREKLNSAGIIIGTYSSWGSLFSEAMAGLLSYGPEETRQEVIDQVEHNRKLLEGAEIKLDMTTLSDGKTVKVQFKNAKDSAAAIKVLLKDGQGLDRINLPIDKISQLVGDELDYAATIPASALASAAGKYSKQYGMVDYYDKLLSGATIEVQDYAYLGINEERLNTDRETLGRKNGITQIQQTRDSYKAISDAITETYKGISDKKDKDALTASVLESEAVKSAMEILGLGTEQVKGIIAEQYSSIRNLEVRSRLLGLEGYDKLDAIVGEEHIDIATMSRFTEGDKGTRKIVEGEDSLIKTVTAEDEQEGYKSNMIENIREAVKSVMKRHAKEDVDGQDKDKKPVIKQDQYDKALEELIKKIYEEYGDVFRTETEVREFLVTGMDALSLYNAKNEEDEVGLGAYLVDVDEKTGKAQNVYITNNGTPMKSLNMPGMWTIELMEGCDSINKPSLETFISSKEALAAFEWSIGFSGTFSSSIRTLLKDLDYAKIGGSMPDTMKVGVTTALTQTQEEMATVIAQARQKLNADGIAGVDLIMTANSDGTTQMVEQLQKNGIKEDDIVSLSLDLLDRELTKLSDIKKYPSAKVAEVMKSAGVEDYSVNDLAKIDMNVKIKVLQEVLKNVMKKGEVSFIVGDVSLLGRGWNPGKMDGAIDNLKAKQNIKGDAKVQATMWKVNFEKMDATQSEQGDGRFAHRDGTSRFSSEFYNRDIIQITSVDSVRENKILREAAAKEGGYSVEMILNNLNDVMEANEESTLQKANNAVVNQTKVWAQKQKAADITAPTYGEAKGALAAIIGEEEADRVMKTIKELKRDTTADTTIPMLRDTWFAYDSYMKYAAASKEFNVAPVTDTSDVKVQGVLAGDVLAGLELIQAQKPKVSVNDLIRAIRELNDNYAMQQGKITAIYQEMTPERKAAYDELVEKSNKGEKISLADRLRFRDIMGAQGQLQKYESNFERANSGVYGKLLKASEGNIDAGNLGLIFDRETKRVMYMPSGAKTEQTLGKIVSLSKEDGQEKLAETLKKLTLEQVRHPRPRCK